MKSVNSFKSIKSTVTRGFVPLLTAAAFFSACSNNDENTVVNDNDRVAVKFASTEASIVTRVIDDKWDTDDKIGIYMIANDATGLTAGDIKEGANNICYKAAGSGSQDFSINDVAKTIYYPVSGAVKFIAYYPYVENVSSYTLNIDLSSQGNQSAIDVLYAATNNGGSGYTKTSSAVTLPFAHKLAKVVFNISNGAGVNENLANGLVVKITGQNTSGSLALATGVVTSTGGESSEIQAHNSGNNTKAEAIVFPGTKGSKQFSFKNAANETFITAIPDDFEAGKKYTYTVTLKKTAAIINGSISNWQDGANNIVTAE
ncbi:MAG: fimbrillin family protein [Prevotellaceae bacterium]|jgi:hypothetical protein|nr:fimbrillin family protein [Prevotellaceae bacterium]